MMIRHAFTLTACALAVALASAIPATSEPLSGSPLRVDGKFTNKKARSEISGAACAGSNGRRQWCLAVNDERRYAQFFSFSNDQIKPGKVVALLPNRDGKTRFDEIDAEGAAYDDGFLYVIGSHGLSRNSAQLRPAQFFIFRLPVDKETGAPKFKVDREQVAPEIERSGKLRALIASAPHIKTFAEKPLDKNGLNVEGLAVQNGKLYVGFRGPSINGEAFVLETLVNDVFGENTPRATVHALALGKDTGIRDMASVNGGFLILSGPVNTQPVTPAISFWNPRLRKLQKLAELAQVHDGLAETLLVLSETAAGKHSIYRIVVMYDGRPNGQPIMLNVKR